MVTRGALGEAQLRRGIIPHVGLHVCRRGARGARGAPKDCGLLARIKLSRSLRWLRARGARDRLIPVRRVNFHNAN